MFIVTEDGVAITTETGAIITTEGPPPPLQTILEMYPYQQYADDENVVAFFTATNELAQSYLDWFNTTPLAVYSNDSISGALLDWIGVGIYGVPRPVFLTLINRFQGPVNTYAIGGLGINASRKTGTGTAQPSTDDYYKRVITWQTYLGDGRYFSTETLRKRVARFLYGANGSDIQIDQIQNVHIGSGLISSPPAPVLSSTPGGTMYPRTYEVWLTNVTQFGETLAGPPATFRVGSNSLLVVEPPPLTVGVLDYNVYAMTVPGPFRAGVNAFAVGDSPINGTSNPPKRLRRAVGINANPINAVPINGYQQGVYLPSRQNLTPVPIGESWIEPTTGLINGVPLPSVNSSNPATNIIIQVPSGTSSEFFQQAFNQGILSFPFMLQAIVLIEG